MTREFSAGGIVFKKLKAGSAKREDLLWLICQHSQHKGWVFPKGLIGDNIKGEKSENTAVREVREETGIEGKIIAKLPNPATYWYVWQGEKRFKTVSYFLMEYISGDIKNHDFEMSEVIWLPTDKVMERLTYKSDKLAFGEALKLMDKLPS
ncbi:NUDIX domain-containing protein [Candidatus Gottesmanbacteria bacterium]|nr:NUDIX domain-containing protein [Candidatus Gottesmanbacteria bacterium]